MNRGVSNPAIIRVIKKKIDALKKLEQIYWSVIIEQREKLSDIDTSYEEQFEDIFPKDQSSLIYACIDGAVLIRHSENKIPNSVDVRIIEAWLEVFLKGNSNSI